MTTFAEFFRAATGNEPSPYQRCLAEGLIADRRPGGGLSGSGIPEVRMKPLRSKGFRPPSSPSPSWERPLCRWTERGSVTTDRPCRPCSVRSLRGTSGQTGP